MKVTTETAPRPNIVFILTDDLGYGDIGVFFQNSRRASGNRNLPSHATPNLDRIAAEGMQLRHHYCPASVCAPSRASLMLGVHQGHANVRNNQFDKTLEDNHTLASVLKTAGYATAAFGKWGLQGEADPNVPHGFPGHPMNRGFDDYFGYIGHRDGHQHYPKEDGKPLYDGAEEVSQIYDKCYTTDLFTARSKKWIADQQAASPDRPFFVYLAYDTPHAALTLPTGPMPEEGLQWIGEPGRMINTAVGEPDSYLYPEYAAATWDHDNDPATPEVAWPDVYQRYASLVRRIDESVGDLIGFLKASGLDDNTLIVFTTDNGPSKESYLAEEYAPTFFDSFGPMDGIKRDLWEGGIRVGALVRWPAGIAANQISNHPSGFWDWMPTFSEAAGLPAPARSDGVSLLPTLTGTGEQNPSTIYLEYFQGQETPDYEEFETDRRGRTRNQMQAIRIGDHVGVRYDIQSHEDSFEIYNAVTDAKETTNLAADPAFAALQQAMKDSVLRLRRPDTEAPRPYDGEFVPALSIPEANLEPGIRWRGHDGAFPWVTNLDGVGSTTSGNAASIEGLGPEALAHPNLTIGGYLRIRVAGDHVFALTGDSPAGLLRIHGATVLDHDRGDAQAKSIRLAAGLHPFTLALKQSSADSSQARLAMVRLDPDGEKALNPDFFRDRG